MNAFDFNIKAAGKARREKEIAEHGKQVFFTRGGAQKLKTAYSRKEKHKTNYLMCI